MAFLAFGVYVIVYVKLETNKSALAFTVPYGKLHLREVLIMNPTVCKCQFISKRISNFTQELHDLLKKYDATLEFEGESIEGQGAMLTINMGEDLVDRIEIEVESPDSFDLDSDILEVALNQATVVPD
jgi:hypothetical protein